MKKLIIILILIMLNISVELYAGCEDGYTSATITVPVNGCDYTVYICYKCITPALSMCISVDEFFKSDPGCEQSWIADSVLSSIYKYFYNNYTIFNYCNDSLPPCNSVDRVPVVYRYPKCWNKVLENDDNIHYKNCYIRFCCQLVEYCYNYQTHRIEWSIISESWCDYSGDCEDPEPEDPTEENEPTGCFYLWTPCND